MSKTESTPLDLTQYGLTVADIRRNLSPAELYLEAIRADAKCNIADTGALIALSGEKTGRSPKDKRVVEHPESKDQVWWGAVNVAATAQKLAGLFRDNFEKYADGASADVRAAGPVM
jgi:phosphoenolpyruvate carboxykinase (ATP)